MNSNAPRTTSVTVGYSASPSGQPFPGAAPATSPVSQPRRTVMEIPSPLPRPSFIFRGDGSYSNDASRVFAAWKSRLDQCISASSSTADINGIHHPRCFLLSAACKRHDIAYIVMHHRYCTWSRNREAAYQLMQPYGPADIDRAFAALSVLLKNNDVLSTTQVEWFSNFPAATFDSYIPGPILASITKEIFEFLSIFAAQWHGFQAHIIARDFPPLVWEIAQTLRCSSSSIQDLIFTLSRRLLGCPDGPFSNAFAELFASDRHFESSIQSSRFSPAHIQHIRNTLVKKYIDLVAQFRSQAHTVASPSLPAPPVRTPAAQITTQRPSPASQSPMLSEAASLLPSTEQPTQTRHSSTPTVINRNMPSTIPSTIRPIASAYGSADAIRTIAQYTGTSKNHPAATGPPPVHPQNILASMAQPKQSAMTQNKILPAQNLAALFDPAPGKVFRPIPESEYPHSAYSLSSLKVGLHLARQRSPCRVPISIENTKYYQYVESFIVQPTKLNGACLPIRDGGNRDKRVEVGGSQHILANSDAYDDLPAEMSTDLKVGYNELHISLPSLSGNERGHDYFLAVELITTQNHASVCAGINNNPRSSAETTKNIIKQCYGLSGTNEIALLGSTSNISVCDPISSRMCDTPVRGFNCKHLQCFDLDNWLQSRTRKPGSVPTEPCLIDSWACPICGGDARPNQLRICDYFSNIVKQLRESGHSDTRTIAVSNSGEWESQVEASHHQKRESSSQPSGLLHQPHQISKDVEVIEILDD
ncbi:hypothetical protein LLEC1_04368 [Akanthomyces lecanii]|uniref:SP-RING-type domain-containing protein n=1 Tax=Cordyceps confragosa TaxID=2714763 RepID=A0A179I304_CORDF|nr:hypothetical protein LLEC1_04368 [Akanthomyces lecanii]